MTTTYGMGMQDFAAAFNHYLGTRGCEGVIIADSRTHESNVRVAHSIHTQKYRSGADPYPHIAEVPIFAASDNHAGLQIADMLATALFFPMVVAAFVEPRGGFVHEPQRYVNVRAEFGLRVRTLGYTAPGKFGLRGFDVKDRRRSMPNASLFPSAPTMSGDPSN